MKNAGVAQLVEQLTCNQQVGGSNPFASSVTGLHTELPTWRELDASWPNGAHVFIWADAGVGEPGRTVNPLAYALEGSNPPPPTACLALVDRGQVAVDVDKDEHRFLEGAKLSRGEQASSESGFVKSKSKRGSNSVGRVTAFQAVGRGFESRLPLSDGRFLVGGVPGCVVGLLV